MTTCRYEPTANPGLQPAESGHATRSHGMLRNAGSAERQEPVIPLWHSQHQLTA
jgi:hypothetical protein